MSISRSPDAPIPSLPHRRPSQGDMMFYASFKTLLPWAIVVTLGAASPTAALSTRRASLQAVLQSHWDGWLHANPAFASTLGDRRFNALLPDSSEAGAKAWYRQDRTDLKKLLAINPSGFTDQERLNLDLMIHAIRLELEAEPFKAWEMPVSSMDGPQVLFSENVPQWPFQTVQDFQDYLSRLNAVPEYLDQNLRALRQGLVDGRVPTKATVGIAISQCEALLTPEGSTAIFGQPLKAFPDFFSDADKTRLKQALEAAVTSKVLPAYVRFAAFLKDEYAPHARAEEGLWSLPNGGKYYEYLVRVETSSRKTPEEVHKVGLGEVARIEKAMATVAQKLGFKDTAALNASLPGNPALHAKSREEVLDLYRRYVQQMNLKLPTLFSRLPKSQLQVVALDLVQEKGVPTAQYRPGTPDGSRPGLLQVNTGGFEHGLTLGIESTAYHEGVPGHHLQVSLATEMPDLPPFRTSPIITDGEAFLEGWALYAEALSKELGGYQDPYSYYGYLQADMLRALRLVVDTGLHAKHWSRQQAVDYFHAHSGLEERQVQAEVSRYLAIPAQALTYKSGQLRLLEVRTYAEKALGPNFDLRAFHDRVLEGGFLPLDILEARVKAWVASQGTGNNRTR